MPAKKKVTDTQPEAAAPAPKRRAPARTKAAEAAPESPKAKAPASKKAAPKTPAATHKAPARKVTPRKTTAKTPAFDIELHRAEIEREAYFLWLSRGSAHGDAGSDWLQAVEIVKTRHS
ncbi:MAG: DUF2934 domain-containing protein [Bryobacteraceae bacterium]|nr:DUF2934 domain-containing protein [Bryobacteraceae bacterium]